MKADKIGFRSLNEHFWLISPNRAFDQLADTIPHYDTCDAVLAYGYTDHTAGLTLDIMASAVYEGDMIHYFPVDSDKRSICRIDSLAGAEAELAPDEGSLRRQFQERLTMLSIYKENEDIERVREEPALDGLRHPYYPDDVKVFLIKEGLTTEQCWARIEGIGPEAVLEGTLLNEPDQDFGVNLSDRIRFRLIEMSDGEYVCIADFNAGSAGIEETDKVRDLIRRFTKEDTQENFVAVLEALCMADVWVPEGKLIGKGDRIYFPVFTSRSEMQGPYLEEGKYSLKSFAAAMRLALGEERDVAGIIVNVRSEPFLIPKEFFEILLDLARSNGTEE